MLQQQFLNFKEVFAATACHLQEKIKGSTPGQLNRNKAILQVKLKQSHVHARERLHYEGGICRWNLSCRWIGRGP